MNKLYHQHDGKVVSADSNFSHVMAIALDPRTNYNEGVIRCITSRTGNLDVSGYVDRSELHIVKRDPDGNFEIAKRLEMKNEFEIIDFLKGDLDFIGLEDPDIWIDKENDLLHLYFTLPLIKKNDSAKTQIHLGHAVGKDLHSLEMTEPILLADAVGGAKELSIAPVNRNGVRLNLVESRKVEQDFKYSVVRLSISEDMGKRW